MKESSLISITSFIDREKNINELAAAFEKSGVIFPEDPEEKEKLVARYASEIFENLSLEYKFQDLIKKHIALGKTTRKREIINNQGWARDYSLSQIDDSRIEKNFSKTFERYFVGQKHLWSGEKKIEMKAELDKLLRTPFLEKTTVVCETTQQNGYPIELIKELGIEGDSMKSVSFTIGQVERLMRQKKINMYGVEDNNQSFSPNNYFLIKWLDNEICLLGISYSDHGKAYGYGVRPFVPKQWDSLVNEYYPIPKGSKVFLRLPAEE